MESVLQSQNQLDAVLAKSGAFATSILQITNDLFDLTVVQVGCVTIQRESLLRG
jgi:hypothetical protein